MAGSPAESGPGGTAPIAWRPLLAFYVFLALLTGAESFTGRRESVYYAADKHEAAWRAFMARGFESPGVRVQDINVGSYCRRPLMPGLVDLVARMGVPWPYAFSLLRLLSILAAYLAFHGYLRAWFHDEAAVLGTLFVAASVPLTFVSAWWEIISDFPELLAFTLGLWAIRSRQRLGLALATFAGTLNRETTALLVVIAGVYVVLSWREKRADLATGLAALGGWLGATLPLHWWLATGTPSDSIATRLHLFEHNLLGLSQLLVKPHPYNAYLLPVYLFGAFWVLPLLGWRGLPPVLRAGLASAPLFLLIVVVVGGLNEPRQLMPLYPILVPASLFVLLPGALLRPAAGVVAAPLEPGPKVA